MASTYQLLLPLLLLLLLQLPQLSSAEQLTVWDILDQNGLPRGLVPSSVTGYTLGDDGSFVITLEKPCSVQFDYLVSYDAVISGTIHQKSIKDVQGIQANVFLFVWLDVTGIDADASGENVVFHIGSISKSFPSKQFEDVPTCKNTFSGLLRLPREGKTNAGRLFQQLLLPDV